MSRGLCRECTRNVAYAILGIGEDAAMLDTAETQRETGAAEHVSGTPEPQIPLNTTVIGLRSTLSDWCQAALVMVAESLNIVPEGRQKQRGYPVREYPAIAQAARILPDNMTKLLEAKSQPVNTWTRSGEARQVREMDGIDVALRITQVHWQIRSILGEPKPRRRLSMPCPVLDCGAMTLGINEGDRDVTCTSCGGRWSEAVYDWLATFLISERKRSAEERAVLEWLLAEQTWENNVRKWLLAERDWRMAQIHKLAGFTELEVRMYDAYAVIEILREIMQ